MIETGQSTKTVSLTVAALLVAALTALGCESRPGYYPNQDLSLRKPIRTIRADSVQRIYPAEAARVKGIAARSQVGYMAKTVDVANLTDTDWTEVEVWVNETYVCYLPKIEAGVLKSIPWDALYDRDAKTLPKESHNFVVNTVEVYMGGKLYEVPVRLAY